MSLDLLASQLGAFAQALPEATLDHPWGESAYKVRKKVFLFANRLEGALSFTVKLPQSAARTLERPDASPTGYGLGRSGWVTLRIAAPEEPAPLCALIEESYRAVAPKPLGRLLL